MDINNIKGIKALEILKSYDGINPYILQLKEELKKTPSKLLTEVQKAYIVDNANYVIKAIDKVVEISDLLGESLRNESMLDFTPKRIMIDFIIGESDKAYHVIGRLTKKQKPKMYFLNKVLVLEDFLLEELKYKVDFDKFDERLMKVKGFRLLEHQKKGIEFLLGRKGAILADDMGTGKGEPLSTKLYTPYGRKRMGDIKPGDEVIGSDGKSTIVEAIFPLGVEKIYRVTFNDGFYLDVTGEHLWEVYSSNNGYNQTERKSSREVKKYVLNTNQLMDPNGVYTYKSLQNKEIGIKTYFKHKNGNLKWQIPMVEPIQFELGNVLPLDPYLLGISLGDGHITKNGRVDFEVSAKDFEELLVDIEYDEVKTSENKRKASIKFLKEEIISLGLNSTLSDTKFIPEIYKTGSVDERLSLLQGLMDTDGYAGPSGTEFCTVSKRLADDVAEIVHTLGGIVRIKTKTGSYKKEDGSRVNCKVAYRLNIKLPSNMNPFRLKRKADLYNVPTKYKVGRYIKNIEYIGDEEAQCIRVSAENHLYVSNHAIVTHNTITTIVAALATKLKRVLVVCPSSVKINWERELNIFTENTSVVEGRIFNQARFTIINPDILQNFHTLDSKVDPNDPPMYLARELVNAKFDLIIIDEAHNLRNKSSIRGEIMSELCTKFGSPTVWLLSGTPVANRPKDFYNLLKLIKSPIADNFPHYMKRYCDGRQINKKLSNGKDKKIWLANGASNLDELSKRTKHLVLRRLKTEVNEMPDKLITNVYLKMPDNVRRDYDKVWDEYLLERAKQQKRGNIQREMVELGLLRKFVAMEAIPYTYEMAMQAIDDGKKVVIFTTFNDEQQELAEKFGNIAVCHNGSLSLKDKQHSVDAFQNNPKVKVFIGNVISAGVGITLTSGTVTIFNSFSWIPGDNDQAEDRTYRVGQQNDCNIYYMIFQDSVSEKVLGTLKSKRNMIEQIIDNNENRDIMEILMDAILENVE